MTSPWSDASQMPLDETTITVQHGRDVYVVDVQPTPPRILSTISFPSRPSAVALDGQQLISVVSSDVGGEEIIVYDLSDPSNPLEESSQSIEGAIMRAWITDEKIVLLTIDPTELPEPVPALTLDDLTSLEGEWLDWQEPVWSMPIPTVQVYDMDRLEAGPVIRKQMKNAFDDAVFTPEGFVTMTSIMMSRNESGESLPLTESQHQPDDPTEIFVSTELSYWSVDSTNGSLELLATHLIEDGRPLGDFQKVTTGDETFVFLVTTKEANPSDVTLHRLQLQNQSGFEYSELSFSETLQDNWINEFEIDGETGVIGASTKLINIDLLLEKSPEILSIREFPEEISAWRKLSQDRWLRVFNTHHLNGDIDGESVSLEVIDANDPSTYSSDRSITIEGEELTWSCLMNSAFTYLPKNQVVIASIPLLERNADDALFSESFTKAQADENFIADYSTDLPAALWPPHDLTTELQVFSISSVGLLSKVGVVRIEGYVQSIDEVGGRISLVASHDLIMIDLLDEKIATSPLSLLPAQSAEDVFGGVTQQLMDALNRLGLGFVEAMMESRSIDVDEVGFSRTSLAGDDALISITVGDECWKIRIPEVGDAEMVTGEWRTMTTLDVQPDVNRDGAIDTSDVGMLIGRLNDRGVYPQATFFLSDSKEAWMDVNGDGWLSPLDPLVVINRMNDARFSSVGEAEGESAAISLAMSNVWDFRRMLPNPHSNSGSVSILEFDGEWIPTEALSDVLMSDRRSFRSQNGDVAGRVIDSVLTDLDYEDGGYSTEWTDGLDESAKALSINVAFLPSGYVPRILHR